jgi:hypothetical protein
VAQEQRQRQVQLQRQERHQRQGALLLFDHKQLKQELAKQAIRAERVILKSLNNIKK